MSEPTPTSRNAMNLRSFQITNYRNIINSGTIDVTRMAVLVGQNECGKSNLLSALKCINPFDESSYNIDEDWPIDNWPPPSKSPVVSTAHFDLEPDDIAALFEGASPAPSDAAIAHVPPTKLRIMVTKNYSNEITVDLGEWNAKLTPAKVTEIVKARMPRCVYMADYSIFQGQHLNFPDLYSRSQQPQPLSEPEKTLMMALDLAALDLGKLINNPDGPRRTFYTTAASGYLTRRFADKWKQRAISFDIRVDGNFINIYVQDDGLRVPIPLERRSAGFQWYVSFIWRFTYASNGEFKNCILLLDEPGVRLHHAGHLDLLNFLSSLSEQNTVLYTTHLATMIDNAYPERVRIMEVHEHHARVVNSVVSSQHQPMMVIEAGLGLIGQMAGLLGNRQNLVVEGIDDKIILEKLSGVLRASNEASLSDRIYLLPADGASKTPMYAAFLIGNGFDAGVLVDSDKAGDDAIQKIKEQRVAEAAASSKAKFKYLKLGNLVDAGSDEFAIEDLFPSNFYIECINEAYRTNLTEADLPTDGSTQIAKRVEAVLQKQGRIQGRLDKKLIMMVLQRRFDGFTDASALPTGTADKARKVVAAVNQAFEEPAATGTRQSGRNRSRA